MAHARARTAAPPQPRDLAAAGLRTFFRILEAWGLGDAEGMRLLGCPRSTYYRWKAKPGSARLTPDTLERISYIFGIYKDLQILLPKQEAADSWITRPNQAPIFGGGRPMDRLLGGKVADLYAVHQYLDAQRGGWA